MTYPAVISALLAEKRVNELGPGRPNVAVREKLANLTIDKAFAGLELKDRNMASACLAGLWLYHDFLDEGHTICQDIATPSGSYWHAIMHRREPDYSNAKYWFQRVGSHDIFPQLRHAAFDLAGENDAGEAAAFFRSRPAWDPYAFVGLCAQVTAGQSTADKLCRAIQLKEWELLFDYCFQHAVNNS